MQQPTILVADDDESIRFLLTTMLDEAGYHTLPAESGATAIKLALEHQPDVIILDVMMPGMDGFTTCRAIKADRRTTDIPVLLLTALAQIQSKVQGLDCGANDYITKPFSGAELLARVRAALSLKTRHDALTAEALTDTLTSLANRRGLEQQFDHLLAHAERVGETLSILIFDVDYFKAVNDTYGHEAGDVVLAALAHYAQDILRAQDVIGRFGGEEFIAVLPGTERHAALAAAERLRTRIEETPVETAEGKVSVTVSIGVATALPGMESTRASLVTAADRALYAAKNAGRNRVVHADGQPTAPLAPTEPPEVARALLDALALVHAPTAEHSRAVADACWYIGMALRLAPAERGRVALAGLLHDIGKLANPGALTQGANGQNGHPDAAMRASIDRGTQLITQLPALHAVAPLVAAQQEWWDGSGYPEGLHGEEIPLGSRIVAVADAYDLLRRAHLNGSARGEAEIADALRDGAGTRFDPDVVEAAIHILG